jgi:hypothetical protein
MEEILLSTINEHGILPSFLELHSLHQLAAAPALTFRHLVSSLLPTSLQEYSESCYEVISLATLLVQAKVMLNTGASVGEHLYGLVQVTKSASGTYKTLTPSEKKLCVISMLLPFALLRLKEASLSPDEDDAFGDDGIGTGNVNEEVLSTSRSLPDDLRRLRSFFTQLMKKHKFSIALLCMLHKMSVGAQQLAYLFSMTSSFYPVHQYLGISLVRKKELPAPLAAAGTAPQTSPTNHTVTILFITALCFKVAEMLNRVDTSPPAVEDNSSEENDALLPSPPVVLTHYCQLPSDPLLCPLCAQTRKDPSASRGGYVFCYSCLCTSLARHPFCPVTGIGCTVEDVIKLRN